jgi:hypothetical protein
MLSIQLAQVGDAYDSSTDFVTTRVQVTQSQLDGLIAIGDRHIRAYHTDGILRYHTQYPGMLVELSPITNANMQLRPDYQTIYAGTKLQVTFGPPEQLGNKTMMDRAHHDLSKMKVDRLTEWYRVCLDPDGTYKDLTLNFYVGASCQAMEDSSTAMPCAAAWDLSGELTGTESYLGGAVLSRMPDGVRRLFSSVPTEVHLHALTIQYNTTPTHWNTKYSNEEVERDGIGAVAPTLNTRGEYLADPEAIVYIWFTTATGKQADKGEALVRPPGEVDFHKVHKDFKDALRNGAVHAAEKGSARLRAIC